MIPKRFLCTLAFLATSGFLLQARAEIPIQVENQKPVDPKKDSWLPDLDPKTYEAKNIGINGAIDGYPSEWSYKQGDTLALKVSTPSARFRTRIYRIGWYANSPVGPVGSRLVTDIPDTPGGRRPFPAENLDTGLAEPNWPDSLTVKIGPDWTPGQYVVRFTAEGGMEGFTHFIVRDDAASHRSAILYVDSLLTENAYDPWPKLLDPATGKQLYGKSTYSYNSAGGDVKASGAKQAVEVSLSRPRGENWGLSIWRDWTIPAVQFLEKYGFDVAYATSVDLHDGRVLAGRKMWMDSGHDEYWTREMWDNLEEARNVGLNLAWFSGNDLSWQVRLERGVSGKNDKMVAYKIAAFPDTGRCGTCWDWGGDPEFQAALKAKKEGSVSQQIAHLKRVTYAWAGLKDWDPDAPSPVFGPGQKGAPLAAPAKISRLAIGFEGLMNGPKLPSSCPASDARSVCRGIDWLVDHADHWVYTGVGVKGGQASGLANGDRIPMIVGYEMDNARLDKEYPSRPRTQVVLGHTDGKFTPEKGSATDFEGLFNAQYYQHEKGAHVFSAGTINWFWGVEREGLGNWGGLDLKLQVKPGVTLDKAVTAITLNVINKLQDGPGTPSTFVPDPNGPDEDAGVDNPAGVDPKKTVDASSSCGCSTVGLATQGTFASLGLTAVLALLLRRRPRR